MHREQWDDHDATRLLDEFKAEIKKLEDELQSSDPESEARAQEKHEQTTLEVYLEASKHVKDDKADELLKEAKTSFEKCGGRALLTLTTVENKETLVKVLYVIHCHDSFWHVSCHIMYL